MFYRRLSGILKRRVQRLCSSIVYASDGYVDLKGTLNSMSPELIDFSIGASGERDKRLSRAVDLITPEPIGLDRMVRVGGDADGGYVMLDDFEVAGAISIGVGPDVSWDADIAGRGIPVAMFDHTVRRPPRRVPNSRFFRIGVGQGNGLRPLDQLVEMSGLGGVGDLLLKIDVEGAEWQVFNQTTSALLNRFSQICCEFHGLSGLRDVASSGGILDALSQIAHTHAPIHVHANNYSPILRYDRYWFPDSVEVSYVRRDLLPRPVNTLRMATELDRPNDPRIADIRLERALLRGDCSRNAT